MENTASDSGFSKTLHVFSPTADAVDSTMQPPFEFSKMNIKQIADEIIAPLGISVEIDPLVSLPADLAPFDRVTADANQTRFDFLAGLAKQRGLLISNTPQGSLKIWRANTAGAPVDSLEESMPPAREMSARFEGRKRYNVYQAVGRSPGRKARPKTATSKDDRVPRSRFYTFTSDETIGSDIQRAADWQRSKQIADSLTMDFPVSSWYNKTGNLWQENTIVTVKSQTLEVPNGFDFLIRAVEFAFETTGTTAVLSLVPPQAYTEQPIVEPW
jgi:prophage tail gpP-like protein